MYNRTKIKILPFIALILSFCGNSLFSQDTTAVDPCVEEGYYLSFVATPPDCFGEANGNATVATPGCTCMFDGCEFNWENGEVFHTIVNLTAGIYPVTVVHPNGCSLSGEVEVPQAPRYIDGFDLLNNYCKGGNDGLLMVKPMPDFYGLLTYEWSTGATTQKIENLAAGEYWVTVTEFGGCSTTEQFNIEEPEETLQMTFLTSPSCDNINNGSIEISLSGGAPPYIHFCNGIERDELLLTELGQGWHTIKVVDANYCLVEVDVEVESIEMTEPEVSASVYEICPGESANLSLFMGGGILYEWSPTEGVSNPNSNVITVTPIETTVYTVVVTNGVGCQKRTSVEIALKECTDEPDDIVGINQAIETGIRLFPNPVKDLLNISSESPIVINSMQIVDIFGKTVLDFKTMSSNSLDLSTLPNGIYFVRIYTENGFLNQKISKI